MSEKESSFISWEQSTDVFRWSGLVIGCLAMMVSSSFMAFSAYANDLKELFNVTQSDIELMAGLANLGSCTGLPAGLLLEGCGPMATSGTALFITLSSTLALWSACNQPQAYSQRTPLLCFYMFLYGFGAVFVYLTVMTVNIRNFHHDHRAKVIAFTGAMWWMGPAVFSAVYDILFRDSGDLGAYFLFVGLTFSVICILMVILLHDISDLDDEDISEVTSPVMDKTDGQGLDGDITGCELIRKMDCHLILWTFFLYAGLQFSFFTNMTAMLQSFRLEVLNDAATIAGPVIAFASKLFSGVLSDTLLNRIPRSLFLVMVGLPQVLAFTINITNANNGYVFMLSVVVLYAAHGVTFTIIPTMLSEYFGTKHFSSNWGTALLGYALIGWVFLFLFGLTYDEHALQLDKSDDEERCYGGRCFTTSLTTAAATSFLACVLSIILVARSVRFWGKEHIKEYEPKSRESYESIKPLTSNEHTTSAESDSKPEPNIALKKLTKTKYDQNAEASETTPINISHRKFTD